MINDELKKELKKLNESFELELDFLKMDKENALKGVEYRFIFQVC